MLRVVCLCAQWCSACRAWQPVWDGLAARRADVQWHWLDIEDEAALMDALDIDIETFPTVLIARDGHALFLGPVLPHANGLEHLIDRLAQDAAASSRVDATATALAAELQAKWGGPKATP